MLPSIIKNGRLLRKLRIKSGISQHQAAREAGCSQPYLCQVEHGIRALSRRIGERLEKLLRVKSGRLSGQRVRVGRPALPDRTRWAKRKLVEPNSGATPPRVRASRFARPKTSLPQDNPLWPISIHLGQEAGQEVDRLESARAEDELYWRRFNSLIFNSWSEKRFLVNLALAGADLLPLRPACSLRVTDSSTGEADGHSPRPAFVLTRGETAMAFFPQLPVWTGKQYRHPDLTAVIARGQRRVAAVVEINGRPFHDDAQKERLRDQELGVFVYHLDAADVGKPGVIEEILAWCEGLVA